MPSGKIVCWELLGQLGTWVGVPVFEELHKIQGVTRMEVERAEVELECHLLRVHGEKERWVKKQENEKSTVIDIFYKGENHNGTLK